MPHTAYWPHPDDLEQAAELTDEWHRQQERLAPNTWSSSPPPESEPACPPRSPHSQSSPYAPPRPKPLWERERLFQEPYYPPGFEALPEDDTDGD